MEQLISLFEKSFTSDNNQDLHQLLESLSSYSHEACFYQTLNMIFQNNAVNPNIKFAGIIFLKNIIQNKWKNYEQEIQFLINQLFIETIIHLHEPYLIYHIMEMSDLLVEYFLHAIEWPRYIFHFINSDSLSSLILTRSLIFQNDKIPISEILTNILTFIFSEFQKGIENPIFLKLSLNIIKHSFGIIQFEENNLIFLILFMMNNFSPDFVLKYLPIFSKISIVNPSIILNIEQQLFSSIAKFLTIPKISIRFFSMFETFSKNDQLWEPLKDNFFQFFIPFFSFNQSETANPVQFINDHYFDSFSSKSDPRSAAYRCLEVISQYRPAVIFTLLNLFRAEFEKPSENIYSLAHALSAALKKIDFYLQFPAIAIDLFNFVYQFINTDSVLIKCGILIILQFESYLDTPNETHISQCFQMIFDANELIQFFSMNFLSKTIPCLKNRQIIKQFPSNLFISQILKVSQQFEMPKITDLLRFLFQDPSYLEQINTGLLDIVNSTFSFAQFYFEAQPQSNSIMDVFHSVLTLIFYLNGSQTIEYEICKISFMRSTEMLNEIILIPVMDVMLYSIYYSPQNFDEMWNSFEILLPFLDNMPSLNKETAFSIFAVILLRDPAGLGSRFEVIANMAAMVIQNYDVNDYAIFIAALIKLNFLQIDLLSILVYKINQTWEIDDDKFFHNECIFDLLASLFISSSNLFIGIFNEKLPDFCDDIIANSEKNDLMLILPLIFQFLNDDQKVEAFSMIDQNDQDSDYQEDIISQIDGPLHLPRISLFPESEINNNYFSFIQQLSQ